MHLPTPFLILSVLDEENFLDAIPPPPPSLLPLLAHGRVQAGTLAQWWGAEVQPFI